MVDKRMKDAYIEAVRRFLKNEGYSDEDASNLFQQFLNPCLMTWGFELNPEHLGYEILRLNLLNTNGGNNERSL